MISPILALSGLTKRFPGVVALDGVSLDLMPGEVHAVMGENGAGKSTLMKLAAGVYRPDGGEIRLDGQPFAFAHPAQAAAAGIHVVFQELTVLPNLTVAQNLLIGREPISGRGLWLDRAAMRDQAARILSDLAIPIDPDAPTSLLSAGERQLIEIARAVSRSPKVLILDEPTSSLGRAEEELLFRLVRDLRAKGVALAYITHRMAEVFDLSDRVSVLRDGRHILTAPTKDLTRADLIRAMVGRSVDESRAHPAAAADTVLTLRGLTAGTLVRGVDLDLRRGEVLGLAGLMGAGRTETARVIAGIDPASRGAITLDGKSFAPASPAEAMAAGIAYLSEDRKRLGLHLDLPVAENIALPSLSTLGRNGWIAPARIGTLAKDWMARLSVKAASPAVAVGTLSGGNQQKVAIARWLARSPRVILLDEPTRGVDVGAKAEIYALIRKLAADGAAVLVISSELPEILQVSDRIAVMARGRIAGIMPGHEATEESLLTLAFAEDEKGAA